VWLVRQSRFNVPQTNLTSSANLGGGLYTLVFDGPVTVTGTGIQLQPNILFFSPGNNEWFPCNNTATGTSNTITVLESNGDTDCTKVVIVGSTPQMSATPAIAAAAPIIAV
jgi:hypothetical protein